MTEPYVRFRNAGPAAIAPIRAGEVVLALRHYRGRVDIP